MNTPYSRPTTVDARAIDTWNRRNTASRRAYHEDTKTRRGAFREFGEHSVVVSYYDGKARDVITITVACACVRCDP